MISYEEKKVANISEKTVTYFLDDIANVIDLFSVENINLNDIYSN